MKLGLGLPHLGTLASPDAIRTVARAASRIARSSQRDAWPNTVLARPHPPGEVVPAGWVRSGQVVGDLTACSRLCRR